jgi:hypothetical protein
MICESCGNETGTTTCRSCGATVLALGPHCYSCGAKLENPADDETSDAGDFSSRVLCSDGNCIGVVNEQGVCKVCGKPYVTES